jgi:hypothetical protein
MFPRALEVKLSWYNKRIDDNLLGMRSSVTKDRKISMSSAVKKSLITAYKTSDFIDGYLSNMQQKRCVFAFCVLVCLLVFYDKRNVDRNTQLKLDKDEQWALARPHYRTAVGSKMMDQQSIRVILCEVLLGIKVNKSPKHHQ